MRKAWVENNVIRDIAHANPDSIYHPDIAAFYTVSVPDNAANGDGWVNGKVVKPVPAPVVEPTPAARTWSVSDIRAGLTLTEKVKWDNDSAPEVKTVKTEMASSKELAAVTELLTFLVDASVISQTSMDKILQ
jgi:hypothetical protein